MGYKIGTPVAVIRYMNNEDHIVGYAEVSLYVSTSGYQISNFKPKNLYVSAFGHLPTFFTTCKGADWRLENAEVRARRYAPY
jgi:hypothetical protein